MSCVCNLNLVSCLSSKHHIGPKFYLGKFCRLNSLKGLGKNCIIYAENGNIYMEIKGRKNITFCPQAKANVLMGASFVLSWAKWEKALTWKQMICELFFLGKTINFSPNFSLVKYYFSETILPLKFPQLKYGPHVVYVACLYRNSWIINIY